jgi:hypothetical protein
VQHIRRIKEQAMLALMGQPCWRESMMKEMWMRFMMVVIRKGYETAAADAAPGAEAVAEMMEYNKSLQKAGVLLGLDGLLPFDRSTCFLRGRQGNGYRNTVR